MLNDKIQITSAFVASLLAVAVLSNSVQTANAQENQTEVQESIQVEGIIDELLQVHPVLSELLHEEATGVVEYLNELETQEAVHTLLALKTLQNLVELQSSHEMAEGLGNMTAAMGNQTAAATNQTGP
jgi:hypothetical protein